MDDDLIQKLTGMEEKINSDVKNIELIVNLISHLNVSFLKDKSPLFYNTHHFFFSKQLTIDRKNSPKRLFFKPSNLVKMFSRI